MDREALDEFFARAEDVLTDWHGSTDAMVGHAPVSDDVEALPGDSYYEQPRGAVWSPWATVGHGQPRIEWPALDPEVMRRAMEQVGAAVQRWSDQVSEQLVQFGSAVLSSDQLRLLWGIDPAAAQPIDDPRERALSARRNRNTGPADPVRLDGRRSRRASQ